MTLSRQLLLVIVVVFLLGFIGTFTISVNNTRNFLTEQLESHAQDTATSLGLSLSPPMRGNDLPTMNSMVDAIFDRGYYREITVVKVDGETLIERRNPVRIEGVPPWFVRAIPLATPTREALVMAGWKQAATVHVGSHPGYAYAELWRNTVHTFWWFAASALGILMVGLLILRFVLRPLRAVERQAEAICAREYPVQDKLPRTRELRRVVEAMNRMSLKVKQMFEEQADLTEHLREQSYKDPVTGLGNRRYFNRQLQHLVESPEEFERGALLLVQLDDFKAYNERRGFNAGDELLRRACTLVTAALTETDQWYAARLAGADFAIIAADIGGEEAEQLGQRIQQELTALRDAGLVDGERIAHTGIAPYHKGQSSSDLLAAADMALGAAQALGPNAWHRYRPEQLDQAAVRGAGEWQALLREAVDNANVILHFQPVVRATDAGRHILHHEVLMRIPGSDGEPMAAAVFMPMAERLHLARALDRVMIGKVMDRIAAGIADSTLYSVNLTPGALRDSAFLDWLYGQLESRPGCAGRMIFELPEHGVMASTDAMRNFAQRLSSLGSACSIDHFGRGLGSFGYLRTTRVHYLKIDGSLVRSIDQDKDKQFFVQAIIKTAHSVDIEVIAESVETREEWEVLLSLHIDGMQGYFVGRPKDTET